MKKDMKSGFLAMIFSKPSSAKSKYQELPLDEGVPNNKQQSQVLNSSVIVPLLCFLFGLSVGLTAGVLAWRRDSSNCWIANPVSPIPQEVVQPRIPKVFNPDARYIGPSKDVDQNWLRLVDSDAVWIGNPTEYGLGKGMKAPPQYSRPDDYESRPENFYFVSNMHQVHCLNIIRRRYWHLMTEGYNPNDADAEDWGTHVDHCIEYLRLGVTCGDFLVVEPDSPPGTPYELTVDGLGWGVTHYCIDFDRVLQFQRDQEVLYNQTWQASM